MKYQGFIIKQSYSVFMLMEERLDLQVGNWSRWLTDMFGMDAEDCLQEDQENSENDEKQGRDSEPKPFVLLNDLSDLLMLPKDMLIDRNIRHEVSFMNQMLIFFSGMPPSLFWLVCHCLHSISFIVVQVCPTINLSLIIRVLCNFTPDEFCPDPVPGTVLEALNAEVYLTSLSFLSCSGGYINLLLDLTA